MPARICIIGAGLSGLAAIKSCLDEGLEPVCLERDNDIGGTWRYTEDTDLPRAGVYKGLAMNTSRVMSVFSDFPGTEQEPPWYWSNQQYLQYFREYAERFDLLRHIQFGVTVTKLAAVESNKNSSDPVKWNVDYDLPDGGKRRELFDGVMYGAGLFWCPQYPDIPGLKDFDGEVIHAHNYRVPQSYRDKKICVIGE